jgi:hypothetical protein
MTDSNNNWVLEYNSATKKVQFTEDIGPIQTVWFDPNHIDDVNDADVGILNWNQNDQTLNLHHPNNVTQQIGQEQYILVKNATGSTITNGSYVRFGGASQNGEARISAVPFLANGAYPNLYGLGVATQDITNGQNGFITTFGKVRGIDTTGATSSETWALGDILYANPFTAGKLTKVKPTAPNNVIPVAAVLYVHATQGELFVRPTYEQKYSYGRFSDSTNQSPVLINTPYALTFNTTTVANGVTIGTPTSRIVIEESGFYDFIISMQLTSTNSSAKVFYFWARKNGTDIALSNQRQSITGNGTFQIVVGNVTTSMAAGDYLEIMYAADDTTVSITAPPATAFAPSVPSATLTVAQLAL